MLSKTKPSLYEQLEDLVGDVKHYTYERYLEIVPSEIEDKLELMRMTKDLQCKCEAWAGAFEALCERIEYAIEEEKNATTN